MRSVLLAFALVAAAVSCAGDPINTQGTGGAANGGTTGKGGTTRTGGTTSAGGTTSKGGATGNGGTTSKGGTTGNGGTTSKGGTTGAGGTTSKGGTTGSGGSSQSSGPVDCTDTSTFSSSIKDQYGTATITVDNNSSKSYFMQANWWGQAKQPGPTFLNQSEAVQGIGFTIANPNNTTPTAVDGNPLGFPSIFIGAYGSKKTTGSNLPKAVSSLTSVPTIFSTNADTMGITSYNATYDVWFTASNALVTGSGPGTGGAYLMVWLFKPKDKQPRGVVVANASVVKGVKGGWDVWYDSTNPPCVSYVAITNLASLEFDLNNFIQDAKQNGYGITDSQYLSIVFAGFEIWQGGDGLQLKKFCANVK